MNTEEDEENKIVFSIVAIELKTSTFESPSIVCVSQNPDAGPSHVITFFLRTPGWQSSTPFSSRVEERRKKIFPVCHENIFRAATE